MLDTPTITNPELYRDAVAGLSRSPKSISPKWFYDARGSALFEKITGLAEYYPTRTEISILTERAGDIAARTAPGTLLVELGSGASVKTRLLLDADTALSGYVPVDISGAFLMETAAALATAFPRLEITPLVADFMAPIALPEALHAPKKLLFFPGSTLGNLNATEARALLARLRAMPGVDGFVLGVDLVKDTDTLLRAYDDDAGVTARFNLNLLARLNAEAAADFDLAQFRHEARWNDAHARIEMHLVSRARQSVTLGSHRFGFERGESLHTENSHKFTRDGLTALAGQTGWEVAEFWTDPREFFGVALLRPGASG